VFLWQAAFLARHLSAGENGRQNRALLLKSIGLQLDLGLTTIAFDQYQHVKVKEMLFDTLSYNLLTRISLLHPFDSNTPKKVLPDQELTRVISAIEKMETKTGEFLYQDMQKFEYDQAFSLLDFKTQLRSSFTKHICIIERRRIARLKNESVDESLDPDLNSE
jgi:N-terminal acetyltransferase B complex non-catalytic subunit